MYGKILGLFYIEVATDRFFLIRLASLPNPVSFLRVILKGEGRNGEAT